VGVHSASSRPNYLWKGLYTLVDEVGEYHDEVALILLCTALLSKDAVVCSFEVVELDGSTMHVFHVVSFRAHLTHLGLYGLQLLIHLVHEAVLLLTRLLDLVKHNQSFLRVSLIFGGDLV